MAMATVRQLRSVPRNGETKPIVSANSRIYEQIRQRICDNYFSAGMKLNHQDIAELLGVSRTPVREALERLYQEGLITHVPNRGFFVAQIDADEARQLFELREGLEVCALQLTIERGVRIDLANMRKINRQYRLAVQGSHSRQRMGLDREFHMALAAHSENAHLLKTLDGIFERIMLKLRVEGYASLPSKAYQEHLAILQAISDRDLPTASGLLSTHIRAGFHRLLGHLSRVE